MKAATLLVLVVVAFATVQAGPARENIVIGLSRTFMISTLDVEKCVNKTGVKTDDFEEMEREVNDDSLECDEVAVKRASCALVCCAHVQGLMTDGKVNIPYLQKLITESRIPDYIRAVFIPAIHRCNEAVKDIKDQCDLGYAYLKCVMETTGRFGM